MRSKWMIWISIASMVFGLAGNALAAHGEKPGMKKAILLVGFGTTVPEAQKALDNMETLVRKAFPETEVRWAYTSRMIRAKLAREGRRLDSPEVALARLMEDKYTHVAVLPLHTIPGREFHELHRNTQLFAQMSDGFERILVAQPLLSSHEDMERVAKAMTAHIPEERSPEDAVLLMGHGTEHHPADAIYMAMNQIFQDLDPNVFVGTVEGHPSLDELLPKIEARKVKKAYLMPFMAVAGDHARNDMAGNEPDSWKSILQKKGIACEAVFKGSAEYPEVAEVWIDHLRATWSGL